MKNGKKGDKIKTDGWMVGWMAMVANPVRKESPPPLIVIIIYNVSKLSPGSRGERFFLEVRSDDFIARITCFTGGENLSGFNPNVLQTAMIT